MNHHAVSSPAQLQALLAADLARVSLLYFYADWAEPCKVMAPAVSAIAAAHPHLLVLSIDAEAQPEISESFAVEEVPLCIILRGHDLLNKMSGAQPQLLRDEIAKSLASKSVLSSTSQHPKAPPATAPPNESKHDLQKRCTDIMNQQPIMLFMKGNPSNPRCGFSQKTVNLLREQKVEFGWFDILQDEDVRQEMKVLNDWPTFPQIIVNGELIGGIDILKEMVENGEFQQLVKSIKTQ